jgi:hypothetical protein
MQLLTSYKSDRGVDQVFCEGYPMQLKYFRVTDLKQIWRCSLKKNCPGRAESTPPDHDDLTQTKEHSGHEGDEVWVEVSNALGN